MDFIEVNGTALRYDLAGSGASTLVLIHEMGGTLESWDLVLPMLSAKRRVLRYDTRGAGLSQKVRGTLTIDTMVDDLMALMDALGIAGKVALAGVAVGGAIALHAAVRFPQRVAAVVASSPAIGIAPDRRAGRAGPGRAHGARGPARRVGYARQLHTRRSCAAMRALRRVPRPLARQRSGELWRHLPHARGHGPAARAVAHRLSGAGDCRRARWHASAAAGRAGGARDTRRALRRAGDGTLRGRADA